MTTGATLASARIGMRIPFERGLKAIRNTGHNTLTEVHALDQDRLSAARRQRVSSFSSPMRAAIA